MITDRDKASVGIIGITGRMASLLMRALDNSQRYCVQYGFSRHYRELIDKNYQLAPTLVELLAKSQYIVDFSHPSLLPNILQAALEVPKPLILCTTGWKYNATIQSLIDQLSKKTAVVIAPNSCVGACLQRIIAAKIATTLSGDYDID